ncbi:MAG: MBL fold metallo-hydrolase [Phycisphaerales bacterium]|nr:MBL fold metallo-hydrolase [Phycisphaerales bacterium]
MRVIVTGTGDAFSTERFGSSALIQTPEGFTAIDCPASPLGMYRRASEVSGIAIDPGCIHDLIMTHLHADHAGGLETMAFYRRYKAPDSPKPRLWAAPGVMARMWERLAPSMDGRGLGETPASSLEDFFEPGELALDGDTRVGPLTVRVRWTIHAVPTVGLLISDGESTLGWSSDTEFHVEHADWLAEADLIVHECGESVKHATWEQLSTLPEDLQRRTRLLHVPDDVDLPDGSMKRLHDGEVLEVQSRISESI